MATPSKLYATELNHILFEITINLYKSHAESGVVDKKYYENPHIVKTGNRQPNITRQYKITIAKDTNVYFQYAQKTGDSILDVENIQSELSDQRNIQAIASSFAFTILQLGARGRSGIDPRKLLSVEEWDNNSNEGWKTVRKAMGKHGVSFIRTLYSLGEVAAGTSWWPLVLHPYFTDNKNKIIASEKPTGDTGVIQTIEDKGYLEGKANWQQVKEPPVGGVKPITSVNDENAILCITTLVDAIGAGTQEEYDTYKEDLKTCAKMYNREELTFENSNIYLNYFHLYKLVLHIIQNNENISTKLDLKITYTEIGKITLGKTSTLDGLNRKFNKVVKIDDLLSKLRKDVIGNRLNKKTQLNQLNDNFDVVYGWNNDTFSQNTDQTTLLFGSLISERGPLEGAPFTTFQFFNSDKWKRIGILQYIYLNGILWNNRYKALSLQIRPNDAFKDDTNKFFHKGQILDEQELKKWNERFLMPLKDILFMGKIDNKWISNGTLDSWLQMAKNGKLLNEQNIVMMWTTNSNSTENQLLIKNMEAARAYAEMYGALLFKLFIFTKQDKQEEYVAFKTADTLYDQATINLSKINQ